jgi:hypothetical protein
MKRYIINPETKRYIDADSANGKKIIKEKQKKNQTIEYFSDKKGTRVMEVPQSSVKKAVKAPKVKAVKAPPVHRHNIQQIHVPPQQQPVRPPDQPRVMRLISVPHHTPSIIPSMNDLLSNVLRSSMDTYREQNERRNHMIMDESRRNQQIRRMMMEDNEAKQRQEDQRRRRDLDTNIRNYRVVRFTLKKKSTDNDNKQAEQKLRIQNEKLKEKLENQRKNKEERQKRLKALEKRVKKKN